MDVKQKFMGFKDGLPTGPEVEELRKRWPALEIGQRIGYQEVSETIGVAIDSPRWRSITAAWRKRELENGRVLKCEVGEAFYVATPEHITSTTYSVLAHVGRTAKKQRRDLATVHAVDPVLKGVVEHQGRLMLAVEKDARIKRMNVLPSTKAAEMPAIPPPDRTRKIA